MRPPRNGSDDSAIAAHLRPAKRASGPLRGFCVECQKRNGSWLLFARYQTKAEAEKVRDCLMGLGQSTRVIAPAEANR